jgi:hypothetical protein
MMNDKINKSGFRDESNEPITYKKLEPCMHPQHNPPGHIVVPHGKIYDHVCPACGAIFTIHGSVMRM